MGDNSTNFNPEFSGDALDNLEAAAGALMANPQLSRRSFVSATAVVGALTFLGSVSFPSGTVVNAYADEDGGTHFTVYVLSRYEVPIMALRQTDSGKVGVGGVNVTITSSFNQKQLNVTTGDDGFAVVNVRPLSFECDEDDAPRYSFYGEVLAQKEGCHEIYFPTEYIISGVSPSDDGTRPNVIELPIETDDGSPYLRYVTLDEIDVLHSDAPAYVGDYSDIDHTFDVQVCAPDTSAAVSVELLVDDQQAGSKAATRSASDPKFANATFSDNYLKNITPGQKVKVRFQVGSDPAISATLPLEFKQAITLLQKSHDNQALNIAYEPDGQRDTRPSWQFNWLFGQKSSYTFGIPGCPIDFWSDASGNFGGSITIFSYTFIKDKNGENKLKPEDKFKWFGGKAGSAAYDAWKSGVTDSWKSVEEAYSGLDKNNLFCGKSAKTKTLAVSLDVSAMLSGSSSIVSTEPVYETSSTVDLAFAAKLALNSSCGWQFSVVCIPVYANIDFKVFFQLKIALGLAFKNWWQNVQWGHHYNGSFMPQIVFLVTVEGGLTIAAGFRGIIGIGIRGYVKGIDKSTFDRSSSEHFYHGQVEATANLEFVIQSCIYSYTLPIFDPPGEIFSLDTWDPPKSLTLDGAFVAGSGYDIDLSKAKMFTQEAMTNAAEFEGTVDEVASGSGSESVTAASAAAVATTDGEGAGTGTGTDSGTGTGSDADSGSDEGSTEGFTSGSPATYKRRKLRVTPEGSGTGLVSPGPASAEGFASPYAGLDGSSGKLMSGFTGTSDLAKTGTQSDFAGVTTYNPRLGLVPCGQEMLYKDVYSNARLRTVACSTLYGADAEANTITARVVTSTVTDGDATYARSRICIRRWDASKHAFDEEQVIDFNVDGVLPVNRHDVDYDFEVMMDAYPDAAPHLHVIAAITSLVVDGDKEMPYDDAIASQFVTLVDWNVSAGKCVAAKSLYSELKENGIASYHPRTLLQTRIPKYGVENFNVCFYCFKSDPNNAANSGVYAYAFNLLTQRFLFEVPLNLSAVSGFTGTESDIVKGTFDVTNHRDNKFDQAKGEAGSFDNRFHSLIAWSGTVNGTAASFVQSVRFNANGAVADGQVLLPEATSFSRRKHEFTDYEQVPSRDKVDTAYVYFESSAYMAEKKNHVVQYDAGTGKLSAVEVDGYSTDSHCVVTADGKRMYTIHINDGCSNAVDDDTLELINKGAEVFSSSHYNAKTGANFGGSSYTNTVAEPVYQLFESRWIESLGAFHEFYPIARLAFPPNCMTVLTCGDGRRDFVMTDVTDVEAAKCDVYQVTVPDVLAVQCESAQPETPYAAPGDAVPFVLNVSNTGNALITGFTVTVTDDADKVVFTQTYSDLRDYLRPSAENYHSVREADGTIAQNEDGSWKSEFVEDIRDESGILWPGFIRSYLFTFTLPEGYEGATEFYVHLSDPRSNPYANEASADTVFSQVNAAKASLAAAATDGGSASTLRAAASHLSWLDADEFSESLFGAEVQQIVDPRRHPLAFTVQETTGLASGFSALPAVYEVEGGKKSDGSGNGNGNGNGSGNGSAKTAPSTGDGLGVAGVAAAAVAVGAAGVAAKAVKDSLADEDVSAE